MHRVFQSTLVVFALAAASCSGSSPSTNNAEAEVPAPNREVGGPSTTVPEGLAFAGDEALTLRISVPSLDFVAPHDVDETDPVAVLVTDLLTDGLTERDGASGLAMPGLADSWEVSDDHLVWLFRLGDFTFGDGLPITADDVVASLNRVAQRGLESLSGPNLWPIDGWSEASEDVAVSGIAALGDDVVTITLTERFEPLPEILAGVAFGVFPAQRDTAGSLPVSSSSRFAATALWEDGLRIAGEPVAGEISTIELLVDPAGTLIAAGETDLAVGIDPDEPLGDLRGSTIQRSADAFFAMNAELAPFDDVMIRQAVLHAVDREALVDEFFPHAGLMQGFVPQGVPGGSVDACGDDCAYDVDQARLLVDASPSRDVAFTVDYFLAEGDDDSEQRMAEMIASSLRDVGLVATARSHTPTDYGVRAANGELGMFRFGSISTALSPEADLGAMFETAGRDNLTGTSIERFDAFIAAARVEPNPVVRASIYADAERLLFAEAVALPVAEFRHHVAFTDVLESASLEPDGSLDLEAIVFSGVG